MADTVQATRAVLTTEVRHWHRAARTLADLDMVASPAAWAALESYLESSVRSRLRTAARGVATDAARLDAMLASARDGSDLAAVRKRLLTVRARYLRTEAVVDFFGDAVNTRTEPGISAVLRGLDLLAVASMEPVLDAVHVDVPPVLTYLAKGLGASILPEGARLWDASLSPAAAIKMTHHNLGQPTSLVHETGHQVARLTGWVPELATSLADVVAPVSPVAADVWSGWASEIAADVHAFVLLGYAPLPALATVVDGTTQDVFRMVLGDPHPFGWLRVRFGAALCRDWYGAGPWDELEAVWVDRHDLAGASPLARDIAAATVPLLPRLAARCTRAPMHAFGGRPLCALADPGRVAPSELARFGARAGRAMHTSSYLQRTELMRILAWTVLAEADQDGAGMQSWLAGLGGRPIAA